VLLPLLTLLLNLTLATAQDDSMDSSMDGAMAPDSDQGMMSSLHFRPFADNLWFSAWMPESPGAMVGACMGLFFLALVDRCVAGVRGMAERAWRARCAALIYLLFVVKDRELTDVWGL
jgi:copper transporter 1